MGIMPDGLNKEHLYGIQREFLVYLHASALDRESVNHIIEYERKKRIINNKGRTEYETLISSELEISSSDDIEKVSKAVIEREKKKELAKLNKEFKMTEESKKNIKEETEKDLQNASVEYKKMIEQMNIEQTNFDLLDRRPDA
jgi:hypothetical protein